MRLLRSLRLLNICTEAAVQIRFSRDKVEGSLVIALGGRSTKPLDRFCAVGTDTAALVVCKAHHLLRLQVSECRSLPKELDGLLGVR